MDDELKSELARLDRLFRELADATNHNTMALQQLSDRLEALDK